MTTATTTTPNQFHKLSSTVIQSILLLCYDVKDVMNMMSTCKLIYSVSHESSSLWQSLVYRQFPLCKVIPQGLHGTAGEWKHIFHLEANDARYEHIKCFVTKMTADDDIIGIPLEYTVNPKTKRLDYIYSNMVYISHTAFKSLKCRTTVWRETFNAWIPLYITQHHFQRALPHITQAIAYLYHQNNYSSNKHHQQHQKQQSHRKEGFEPAMILTILPKMMNTIVLLVVDHGVANHEIEQVLRGYCSLHRLFIALIHEFPCLKADIHRQLRQFISDPECRHKDVCRDLGALLPLLSVCETTGWKHIIGALVEESFTRSVLWAAKKCVNFADFVRSRADKQTKKQSHQHQQIRSSPSSSLSSVTVNKLSQPLLDELLTATITSRQIYSFHCCFLKLIAQPEGVKNMEQVCRAYDRLYGLPTCFQIKSFMKNLRKIRNIHTWNDYFDTIHYKQMSSDRLSDLIIKCIDLSLAKRYHHATTNFNQIHKSGVSKLLLRGLSYPRVVMCVDNSESMNKQFHHPDTHQLISRADHVKEVLLGLLTTHLTHSHQFNIIYFDNTLQQLWPDQLKLATPENIKTAIKYCQDQTPTQPVVATSTLINLPSQITNFDLLLNTAFTIPHIQSVYFLSDGDVYDHNNHLVETVRRLSRPSNGNNNNFIIKCHTAAFFAKKDSGVQLLKSMATVTGGTFDRYGEEHHSHSPTAQHHAFFW